MANGPIFKITREGDIVRTDFLRSPDREDMLAALAEVGKMENSELRLYVMVEAEILLSTAEVRDGAGIARNYDSQPRRIAVVAGGNITYGISRIFKVFRESEQTEFEVFRELDEAKTWLLS